MIQRMVVLLVWWLAVVNGAGEATFLEWPTERQCKVWQRVYDKMPNVRVTTCQWQENTYRNPTK